MNAFLVEDSETIRTNLISTLADLAQTRVIAFAVGELEALAWLKANDENWTLAIVDLFLKEGSGLGVVAALQGRRPSQRVVVFSKFAIPHLRER